MKRALFPLSPISTYVAVLSEAVHVVGTSTVTPNTRVPDAMLAKSTDAPDSKSNSTVICCTSSSVTASSCPFVIACVASVAFAMLTFCKSLLTVKNETASALPLIYDPFLPSSTLELTPFKFYFLISATVVIL